MTGLWHLIDTNAGNPCFIAYSPTFSFYYGQDVPCNFDTGVTNSGNLTSPPLFLPAVPTITLSFWYWYQTETTGTFYDRRWVQISAGGGPFNGVVQLSGDIMNQWNLWTVNLSAYAGQIVQIQFYFDTIDSALNNYHGWNIDDVKLNPF